MTDEELEHRLTAVENRAQSNTHRLDELGKLTDAVNGMNTNIKLTILAFCKPHGQFIAHLISFLCGDLSGLERLPNLIGDHITFLPAPSHQFILAFGEHKFFVCGQGAALIAADQFALVRFVRILRIVRAAFQAGRNRLALVLVQRNQTCCSQFYHLPAKRKCRTMAA